MNPLALVPLAAQPVMPWANGGGSTRQVAIDPPGASMASGFRWRVSIAQVGSDGPFSHLPDIDRSLWLLAGDGVRLDVDGREVVLAHALQRFDFAGETPIRCALRRGPCEDLNVMTARASVRVQADVHEVASHRALAVDVAEQALVVALRGGCVADGALTVGEREALRVSGPHRVAIAAQASGATLLVATFRSRA